MNKTGSNIIIKDLFQVGCSASGLITIQIRDGWTLPQRVRWRNEPSVKCHLLPARKYSLEVGDDKKVH